MLWVLIHSLQPGGNTKGGVRVEGSRQLFEHYRIARQFEPEKERVIDALLPALSDPESNVRGNIASVLGFLGSQRARQKIQELLIGDESPFVRQHASLALGYIGNRNSVPVLTGALDDADFHVRENAAEAIWILRASIKPEDHNLWKPIDRKLKELQKQKNKHEKAGEEWEGSGIDYLNSTLKDIHLRE